MRWLLTVPQDLDLAELRREVEAAGARLTGDEPTPLAPQEQVVRAEGPADLHERLGATSMPIQAYPDSEIGLH